MKQSEERLKALEAAIEQSRANCERRIRESEVLISSERRNLMVELERGEERKRFVQAEEEKMLAILGETRSICWQLLNLTTVAKFGEALSEAPVFVWADRARDNVKPKRTSFFYDTVVKAPSNGEAEEYLSFSYFSLPLRFSAEQREATHANGDADGEIERMTLETPVACRLLLLCFLLVQYAFMTVRISTVCTPWFLVQFF